MLIWAQEGFNAVTTCVVVWIEIVMVSSFFGFSSVTTCVVVWIEIKRIRKNPK